METEAKFSLPDPGVYWHLQTASSLAGYELLTQQIQTVRDTYLDTQKRSILAAGFSCRRRRIGPETILMTVKSLEEAEGAIHQRQEFEIYLDSVLPPAEWPDSQVRKLVLQITKLKPLEEIFELQQTRVIRMVQLEGQSFAEFSLDHVSLVANGREQVYHELEVELLPSTSVQILSTIGDILQTEWHLQPEPRSKFERALALFDAMPLDR